MKNDETTFKIRAYGKSELALLYFPDSTKACALRKFNRWLKKNPRLRHLVVRTAHSYAPIDVRKIIYELGDPY